MLYNKTYLQDIKIENSRVWSIMLTLFICYDYNWHFPSQSDIQHWEKAWLITEEGNIFFFLQDHVVYYFLSKLKLENKVIFVWIYRIKGSCNSGKVQGVGHENTQRFGWNSWKSRCLIGRKYVNNLSNNKKRYCTCTITQRETVWEVIA